MLDTGFLTLKLTINIRLTLLYLPTYVRKAARQHVIVDACLCAGECHGKLRKGSQKIGRSGTAPIWSAKKEFRDPCFHNSVIALTLSNIDKLRSCYLQTQLPCRRHRHFAKTSDFYKAASRPKLFRERFSSTEHFRFLANHFTLLRATPWSRRPSSTMFWA